MIHFDDTFPGCFSDGLNACFGCSWSFVRFHDSKQMSKFRVRIQSKRPMPTRCLYAAFCRPLKSPQQCSLRRELSAIRHIIQIPRLALIYRWSRARTVFMDGAGTAASSAETAPPSAATGDDAGSAATAAARPSARTTGGGRAAATAAECRSASTGGRGGLVGRAAGVASVHTAGSGPSARSASALLYVTDPTVMKGDNL